MAHLISSCVGDGKGILIVKTSSNQAIFNFEVFRVASEDPLQLVSESAGRYNNEVQLEPGSYLVLADCSSEVVVIKPKRTTYLTADHIQFLPPEVNEKEHFSFIAQCTRNEKTQTHQRIVNRFDLFVLKGRHDLLVGMKPFKIHSPDTQGDSPELFDRQFQLSAIRVNQHEKSAKESRFFVSANDSVVSVTESQELGKWLFLLPGKYTAELNGSSTLIDLKENESISIEPAFLEVKSPAQANLELAKTIQGSPIAVAINQDHWLALNQLYPVLPGKATLKLTGAENPKEIELIPGEVNSLETHGVQVNLHCPPWDWSCLGSRKIFLYEKNAHYPYAQGLTDIPTLYFEDEAWLTIEGSREIRTKLNSHNLFSELSTATIRLNPKPEFRNGLVTDLVRIESVGENFSGNTLDLPLDLPSIIQITPGSFQLTEYQTSTNVDIDRRKMVRNFRVEALEVLDIEFSPLLSEKKLKSISKLSSRSEQIRQICRRRLIVQRYRTARPLAIF